MQTDHKRGCMSQANTWSVGCNRRGEDEQNASWEKDKLDRKPHADRLTALIQNTRGPYVIGLTSPWGSGKTFSFVHGNAIWSSRKSPVYISMHGKVI